MNILKTLIIFLSLLFSTNGFAQDSAYNPSFLETLNGIDSIPTRRSLESQVGNAGALLEKIGCDKNVNSYTRNRALSFLSMFEKKGMDALVRLSSCNIAETKERAIYTLARTFSSNKNVVKLVLSFDHGQAKTSALWSLRALRWLPGDIAKPTLIELSHSSDLRISKIATKILK